MAKIQRDFPPSQEIAGLSSLFSQDGGVDFTVSSMSEKLYEFHVAPVHASGPPLSSGETVPHHGPSDPTRTAPIKAIPRAVLFAGMALRPDMFAMNRAFTLSRPINGSYRGRRKVISRTLQRVADAFSMSAPSLADLRISGANEALEAWSNCGDVLDLLSVEFRLAEDRQGLALRPSVCRLAP
jgi:hypothetical protein